MSHASLMVVHMRSIGDNESVTGAQVEKPSQKHKEVNYCKFKAIL